MHTIVCDRIISRSCFFVRVVPGTIVHVKNLDRASHISSGKHPKRTVRTPDLCIRSRVREYAKKAHLRLSSFEWCLWFSRKPFGWCAPSKKVKKQFCSNLLRVNQNYIRRLIYYPSWFTSFYAANDFIRKHLKNSLQKYWCSIYKYCYNYCK